jgi:uncharacterized protein (TIGR02145 family)
VNDSRSIAPEGWHVPSDKDWKQLEMHLGMSQSEADEWDDRGTDEGGKLKATGTIEGGDGLWYSPNTGATNSSGFSALPGGRRRYDQGEFSFMGRYVCFWSSTESFTNYAILRMLGYQFPKVRRVSQEENYGYSVRCIKD